MSGLRVEGAGATRVRVDGREHLFFGGCSYLGLHAHPAVVAALAEGAARYGVSSGAARGTSGTTVEHEALEEELGAFVGAEACALLPDAVLANLALARAWVARGDGASLDAEAHPSLVDAVDAAGARVVRYATCDADAARAVAARTASLWTDGTFPAAGRVAPVDALGALDLRLAVDDAHGFGTYAEGRGAGAALDLARDDRALVVALSKALGCAGGAALGTRATVAAVRAQAAYSCTTPLPPALAAAARAALALVRDGEVRARLDANVARLRALAADAGLPVPTTPLPVLAIQLDDEPATRALQARLLDAGVLVPLVEYPGGPAGPYLRLTVTAAHDDEELDRLATALRPR